ncbi:MAG: UDP-N-acetylmuramoyl-tripeptide--D-alanyl-D-alanine ligase [Oscillospiraceae bacterium]|nr:UDP-N-acetylmuramoyl-tripeptide--D-alanyl-D-alanine ligase [Oscillospiraceae bacterium]
MKSMTISMAASACGGRLVGCGNPDAPIGRAVIDSRAVEPGDLFVAFRGERTDGHRFIASALEKGAVCALCAYLPDGTEGPAIVVDDVQRALEQIAAAYRQTLHIPVVGITGSVGKTTAKEMIAAVLSQRCRVLKTEGNLNNQIGVPMTVSRIEREHEAAVVEMGISGFGEMTALARIARPTVAVFTVIGRAHLEFLHDLEGVFRAKTEMLSEMPEDGVVIVNGDDAWLRTLSCRQRLLRYGLGENCEVRACEPELLPEGKTRCRIRFGERELLAEVPAFGRQMIYAALEGAAVGFALGLDDAEIERGIAAYETVGRRGAILDTGCLTLVDDSYNANPESMRCAIDSLTQLPGRHVCVLADMLEMGPESAQMHEDLGRYAQEKGVDLLLCCGMFGREIARGAGERAHWYPTVGELCAALPHTLHRGDSVLVKASRGMHLEEAAEAVKRVELP